MKRDDIVDLLLYHAHWGIQPSDWILKEAAEEIVKLRKRVEQQPNSNVKNKSGRKHTLTT